jgi:DNA processing protein
MDDRTARIALACVAEPGESGIAEMVAEIGVHEALHHTLRRGTGAVPVAGRLAPHEVPAMVAAMSARGVRVLVPGDAEFPTQVLDLAEPPLALWVRGALDLRAAALRSVSIVGARACTPYGERATTALSAGIAELGWAVVSGAAFGIDAAAHRAALGEPGSTIAVLACGIDTAYPRAHESLLSRIADHGAIVTELPPRSAALKHRFLARNRIIAALTRGTVVVEAARRSGALATVHRAQEIGRLVMAVPGPITSMASAGPNRLLHEGAARAVTSPDEVVGLVTGGAVGGDRTAPGWAPGAGRSAAAGPAPDARTALDLTPMAAAVLAALPLRGGRAVDDVAARAVLPPVVCLAQLGVLEMMGLAGRTTRGWRRCR